MGPNVMRHLTHDTVAALLKAQRHLYNESHRYKQFVRFSVSGKVLTSVIKPLNQMLPLIAPHFIDRYPEEAFLIYDETHGMALVYRPGQWAIVPVDSFERNDRTRKSKNTGTCGANTMTPSPLRGGITPNAV